MSDCPKCKHDRHFGSRCRICGCEFGKNCAGSRDQPMNDLDRAIQSETRRSQVTWSPPRTDILRVKKERPKLDPTRAGSTADAEANLMRTLTEKKNRG